MSAPRDNFGRPIVVVTGMGIVTSLGAGKTDNWAKLTAGESGIRTVTRFPIDGLKSTMAGTIDFVSLDPFTSTGLSERLADMATEEALAQSGIGSKGDFPGPLFLAVAPVETEWPQRLELGRACGKPDFDLRRPAARQRRRKIRAISPSLHVRIGSVPPCRDLRHQGIADFAVHGLRIGRDLDPARRGSDPPRRDRRGAVRRDRRLGQPGSHGALLTIVRPVDPKPPAASRIETVLQEPRRLCHGRRRRCPRAGKLRGGEGARRIDPRRSRRLRRAYQLVPPHPLEPGRQADHRLHAQDAGRCRHRARADRSHQRARHRDAGKRQDGVSHDRRRCSATTRRRFRCRRTNRWSVTPSRRPARSKPSSRC